MNRGGSPSVPAGQVGQVLFVLRSADMQLTTDQVFTRQFVGTNYRLLNLTAVCKTGGASVACLGGVYDAANKGGNALVAAGQSWVTLAASVIVVPTTSALTFTAVLSATPYLSLSTGSTAACTADVFIFGYCVD